MQLLRRLCACCQGHVHHVVVVPFFQLAGSVSQPLTEMQNCLHTTSVGVVALAAQLSLGTPNNPFLHSSCVFSIHLTA